MMKMTDQILGCGGGRNNKGGRVCCIATLEDRRMSFGHEIFCSFLESGMKGGSQPGSKWEGGAADRRSGIRIHQMLCEGTDNERSDG